MPDDRLYWRVRSTPFAGNAFAGLGSAIFGGRWNPPGSAVVYCAGSLALAMLQTRLHLAATPPVEEFVAFGFRVSPADIEPIDPRTLPPGWNSLEEFHPATVARGLNWLTRRETVALAVPSSLLPFPGLKEADNNLLLNPAHPGMTNVTFEHEIRFSFDPRLFAGGQ